MSTQQQNDRTDGADSSRRQSAPAGTETETEAGTGTETETETGMGSRLTGDRAKRAGGLVAGGLLLLRGLRRGSARGVAMAVVGAGVLAGTLQSAGRHRTDDGRATSRGPDADSAQAIVSRSVTIGKSADDLYEAWRDPDVLSRVMGEFADVTPTEGDRHRWTVHGPAGTELSWETQVVEDTPGEVVRWEASRDASVSNGGSIRFRPAAGDRGTVVTLSLDFDPPGGTLGNAALERLDVVPGALAGHVLGRFKSLAETGEIPTLDGNPSGRGEADLL